MNQSNPEGIRKPVLIAVWLVVLVAIGAIVAPKMFNRRQAESEPPDSAEAEPAAQPGHSRPKPIHTVNASRPAEPGTPEPVAPSAQPAPRPKPPAPPPPAELPRPNPTPEARALVTALAGLDLTVPLTGEAAAAWKENLARLIQSGAAAVPAIQEFLALNKDVNFENVVGAVGLLGSSSLRMSLLDALGNIGGPEAITLSANLLQNSKDPREIALLAQSLDRQAPEQYRETALATARTVMAEASAGRLAGKDIGPLFEMLRTYGGPNALPDLQQAATGQWKYYATIALADLPEGAGVPALVQMVVDSSTTARGGRAAAMQALAQLTADYPEARDVLLEQARQSAIPDATWINIAAAIAGDRFRIGNLTGETTANLRTWHLALGNQNYSMLPGPLTPEQVQARLRILEEFLTASVNSTFARSALEDARNKLLARLPPPAQ